jgi:hypothetical protein
MYYVKGTNGSVRLMPGTNFDQMVLPFVTFGVYLIHTYIPLTLYPRRGSRGISRNTADVIGDMPIAVLLQSISGVSAIIPLVASYDIHEGKREVLFFYFVPDTTRDHTYTL